MERAMLFFDTEFTDLKQDCDLISIGIAAYIEGVKDENGKPDVVNFYAESIEFSEDKCSDFVREQVLPRMLMLPHLDVQHNEHQDAHGNISVAMCGTEQDIGMALRQWIAQFKKYTDGEKITVWSDCLAYDWVLFCNLLGDPFPEELYYIPFDLATLFKVVGVDPDIKREDYAREYDSQQVDHMETAIRSTTNTDATHNSLFDAMIIYFCWQVATRRIK